MFFPLFALCSSWILRQGQAKHWESLSVTFNMAIPHLSHSVDMGLGTSHSEYGSMKRKICIIHLFYTWHDTMEQKSEQCKKANIENITFYGVIWTGCIQQWTDIASLLRYLILLAQSLFQWHFTGATATCHWLTKQWSFPVTRNYIMSMTMTTYTTMDDELLNHEVEKQSTIHRTCIAMTTSQKIQKKSVKYWDVLNTNTLHSLFSDQISASS